MKKCLTIIITLICLNMQAQQNQTMYFMHIPQANITNPAIYGPCKITISGILIPLSGQLIPPLYLNYNNNGFAYNQFIHHGTGLQVDSLIMDFPNLIDKMRKVNFLQLETQIPWINVSYIWKNWYFSFGINEKINFMASIPRDLILLGWEGNGQSLLGEKAFLSYLGLNMNWFREYSLGAARPIDNKWTVGARAKLLFGKANLWFKNDQFTWKTNKDDFSYTFDTDMQVMQSQPFFDITQFEYNYAQDSLMFDMDTILNPDDMTFKQVKKQVIFNKKNKGFALDLGATYKFNEKITFYGSLLDFGFIRYKQNASGVRTQGQFYFDGWNIQPYIEGNDSISEENTQAFVDSVIQIFNPHLVKKAYTYWLPSRLYLGCTYKFNDKYNVGALFRGEYFLRRVHTALTLSGNAQFAKWFSSSISYTIQNNSFKNLGLGFALKFGWYQWYMVSDNIFGFIFPQSNRTINLRMGMNMIFGCKKRQTSIMLDTKFMQ